MRSRIGVAAVIVSVAAALAIVRPDPAGMVGTGAWAPVLLFAAWLVGTPLLFPGTVLCAAGGLLLGPLGVAVCLVGSPAGALLAFAVARGLGGARLLERLPERTRGVVARSEQRGARSVALVRMAPGLPVCLFNYACGASRLSARSFLIGSAIGAAPRVLLYGSAGGVVLRLGVVGALVGAALLLVVLLGCRRRLA